MTCWHCHAPLTNITSGKLSFRAQCEKCLSDTHCCRGCKFYKVGRHNDCLIPGTEWVSDREKNNFCEEFHPATLSTAKPSINALDKFNRLFKE